MPRYTKKSARRPNRTRHSHGRERRLSVRSELRDKPDVPKIVRAVIALAMAQAEAEAQAERDRTAGRRESSND